MIVMIILVLILFGVWSFNMIKGNLKVIDDKVYNSIKFNDVLTNILKVITVFASVKYFVLLSFLLLLFLENKKLALIIIGLLIIDSLLIEIFKRIFKRERPNIKRLVYEKGYSYPSGHTTSATCFYGFLIFLILISTFPIVAKIVLIILFLSLILVIAFSRIYLGVHYFSDVIGGILFGFSYVLLYVYLIYDVLNFVSSFLK